MGQRRPETPLPPLYSALASYGLALALGILAAYGVVGALSPLVGLVAALPAAALVLVVVAAVGLVAAARFDEALARR